MNQEKKEKLEKKIIKYLPGYNFDIDDNGSFRMDFKIFELDSDRSQTIIEISRFNNFNVQIGLTTKYELLEFYNQLKAYLLENKIIKSDEELKGLTKELYSIFMVNEGEKYPILHELFNNLMKS